VKLIKNKMNESINIDEEAKTGERNYETETHLKLKRTMKKGKAY
jgi:hypothetical protein